MHEATQRQAQSYEEVTAESHVPHGDYTLSSVNSTAGALREQQWFRCQNLQAGEIESTVT